ncbi:acyl-CoA dehydrogenase family protein [Actinoalloteichus fjordicus]|uniref:Acyl-CoA dehydrogenase n=1 Tax=Actinoalloteichus fjordicus TaxID=1612552 RepID=A0AAC9LCC8_9PSEU|nr:hypothetical protein [Actinoalloteichus fjordicus]APU15208.1 acyl-CoA dehydrogenase [Actinoalloteichus fjordicus]
MTVVQEHLALAGFDAVERLSEAAKAHREHGERHGTLHPKVWRMLEESVLPRVAVPTHCGGLEWSVPRILDAVHQVAAADPAAGWVVAIHAPAGAFLSRLDPAVARDLAGRNPVIAGSSLPAGITEQHGTNVRLSGRWPLVTGAPAMTLTALAAPVRSVEGTQAPRWWLVPRDAVTVKEDWDALGLRGSASFTVACDTEVPLAHSIALTDPPRLDTPLYRYPLYGLMAGCIAAVAQATATRALTAFTELAATTDTRHPAGTLADQPIAQTIFARAHGRIRAAAALLETATTAAWTSALIGEVPAGERALLRSACCQMAEAAEHACRDLFDAAGTAAVHRRHGLEGCWRDAVVISRHALVAARGRQLTGAYELSATTGKDL